MNSVEAGIRTAVEPAGRHHPVAVPLHPQSDPGAGPILLGLARAAIAARGGPVVRRADEPAWLAEPGAVFVTLTMDGRLRGCMGSIEPHRPLRDDVTQNACAAAFHDPRFPPLWASGLAYVRIEVSLLSATEPVRFSSRQDLLGRLRPGVEGVMLAWHGHRGTFLPEVWKDLPDPEVFLEHLLRKAGLPASFWRPDVTVHVFRVTAWAEPATLPARTPG